MLASTVSTDCEITQQMLRELCVPLDRNGYHMLCIAIPCFAQDPNQGITKELYPYVASQLSCSTPEAVERSIRSIIHEAWACRDTAIWKQYFPENDKQPSNKQFIATLAERLVQKRTPPVSRRGRNARRRRFCRVCYLCPTLVVSYPKRWAKYK